MFSIKKFPIWSVEIDDVVGATTGLFKVLSDAGTDVHFALSRPIGNKPDKAILFISPIKGKQQEEVARRAGFTFREDVVGVQVDGPNRTGGNFRLTAALAHANLTIRALVTTVNGDRFSAVFAFQSEADADTAVKILAKVVD